MSQEFQPMTSQLSKKVALLLAKIFATCRNNVSNTGRKLRCHWLKFLRHVAKTLVIQDPSLTNKNSIQGSIYMSVVSFLGKTQILWIRKCFNIHMNFDIKWLAKTDGLSYEWSSLASKVNHRSQCSKYTMSVHILGQLTKLDIIGTQKEFSIFIWTLTTFTCQRLLLSAAYVFRHIPHGWF